MKTLSINLLASWVGTVRSFIDGDIFRESNIDLQMGDVADRLGYLKTKADGAAYLAANNAFTGTNTHASNETFNGVTIMNGALTVAGASIHSNNSAGLGTSIAAAHIAQLFLTSRVTLSDANGAIAYGSVVVTVPAITANRTYDLPAVGGDEGAIVIFRRPRTADAFTVTLRDPTGPLTMGVIPVSKAGYMICYSDAGAWKVASHSADVTSVSTAV